MGWGVGYASIQGHVQQHDCKVLGSPVYKYSRWLVACMLPHASRSIVCTSQHGRLCASAIAVSSRGKRGLRHPCPTKRPLSQQPTHIPTPLHWPFPPQVTPIVYAGYLALWRVGAATATMLRMSATLAPVLLLRWHRWAAWRASLLARRLANAARAAAGLPPLRERAPSSFPIKGGRRRLARVARLAGTAAKAVGLQLLGLVASKHGGVSTAAATQPVPPCVSSVGERGAAVAQPHSRPAAATNSRRMLGVMLGLDAKAAAHERRRATQGSESRMSANGCGSSAAAAAPLTPGPARARDARTEFVRCKTVL